MLRSLLLLCELEGGKNGREREILDIESTGLATGLKTGSRRIVRNEGQHLRLQFEEDGSTFSEVE